MPDTIAVLCPTRARRHFVGQMIRSARETAHHPPHIVLYVDDDDDTMRDWDGPATVVRGPRIVLSEAWNRCADHTDAAILFHCGDDIRFRTHGWDSRVRDTFAQYPDRIVLVHGRDGVHDANMATHGFLHRRWIDTVGTFLPPHFSSDYNDLWLTEVADLIARRHYLPDVYTEHLHPAVGKAPLDITHQERLARHARDDCDAIYANTLEERLEWATKLRAAMDPDGRPAPPPAPSAGSVSAS